MIAKKFQCNLYRTFLPDHIAEVQRHLPGGLPGGQTGFFKRWIYAREKEEYLAYDITSISSYSTGNDYIEWGFNRDKEELPQLNLGLAFGESSRIPVFYSIYPGSVPDKSYLDYMLRDSRELGIRYSKPLMKHYPIADIF